MIDEKTIFGIADAKSQQGKTRAEVHRKAVGAKGTADLAQLFSAYENAVEDRAEIENALHVTNKLLLEKHKVTPEQTAIEAIRDVALAAIELAKSISMNSAE